MCEDLYKQEKKPYVEQTEAEGMTDEEASLIAWNKHVYRNESIICDLFHGQFKSTLICALCKRISITFDPFLMAQLPIPEIKIAELKIYYIIYDINNTYKNHLFTIKINSSDRIADLRKKIEKVYGIDASSFIIAWVKDNRVINVYNN